MRIKELRKQRKLTQNEVSNRLGVGRTTYLGYENGKIGIPAKRLEQLADMFGVSIDYISGKTDYKSIYEKWDSEIDVNRLKLDVMARNFASANLIEFLQIAIDELERRAIK